MMSLVKEGNTSIQNILNYFGATRGGTKGIKMFLFVLLFAMSGQILAFCSSMYCPCKINTENEMKINLVCLYISVLYKCG